MRRLIINADDFGLTAGINHGIVECHRAGAVTSATLMAGSAQFEQAVQLARAYPKLGVGCHVILVDGQPLSPVAKVGTLLAPNSSVFRSSAVEFTRAAVRKQIAPQEIIVEARAQVRKLQDAGIKVTHLDSHKHTHIFPVSLKALLSVASELGVRAIRNPFTPLHLVGKAGMIGQPALWLRYTQVLMLSRYAPSFRRTVKDSGLRTTDGAFGVIATGLLNEKILANIIDSIPDGTWELVCHPGYNDAELANVKTRLRESRVVERELLTAPQILDRLKRRGIELISFADL